MFSKTFGYAIRSAALVEMEGKAGHKIGLKEISQRLDIPHHFLGKIMQDLVRHGVVASLKGPSGDFYAHEKTSETTLLEILKITDGSLIFDQCALNIKRCNAVHPCPLHHDFAVCRDAMLKVLSAKTIGMLAAEAEAGVAFLAR
jgi:Rrf2 family protein